MSKMDAYEQEVLTAFEKGVLKSVATKAELAKFKAAARATGQRSQGQYTACVHGFCEQCPQGELLSFDLSFDFYG